MKDRYTAQEYRELITKSEKPSKYHNQKTEVDGRMFHSKKEADYYCQLKQLKKAGEIVDFFCQLPFLVQEGYNKLTDIEMGPNRFSIGPWIKPIYYIADFVVLKHIWYTDRTCDSMFIEKTSVEIHEVKGFKKNQTWEMKRKMFEKRYPEYKLVII